MKDTGYKTIQRERDLCFLKWGFYMKRAQIAEMKLEKLKSLTLLTDDAVSDVTMNELTTRQWLEFVKAFPDEGHADNA